MTDITMCQSADCPVKESCYRYRAKADNYQYYFTGIQPSEKGCGMYWKVSSEEEIDKLNKEWE